MKLPLFVIVCFFGSIVASCGPESSTNQAAEADQKAPCEAVFLSEDLEKPANAEGHWRLEVLDPSTCQSVWSQELPASSHPYQLAEIQYNRTSQLIALKANNQVLVADAANRKLLPPLEPSFLQPRTPKGEESGQIQRLEVWENYLMGYALDYGIFVFDLTEPEKPRAVLPAMEYQPEVGAANALFLLPIAPGDRSQLVVPEYVPDANALLAHPLLDTVQPLIAEIKDVPRNSRYVVLRPQAYAGSEPVAPLAVDLVGRQTRQVPASLSAAPAAEILKWLEDGN